MLDVCIILYHCLGALPYFPVLGQSECSRGFLKVERKVEGGKVERSCIGIEQEIKVSKEEAEKTCKSVNKKAKLAVLTKEEVSFVKKEIKAGKNQVCLDCIMN